MVKKRRYVVSQNQDDIFHLNFINGKTVRKVEQSLNVCRNCLEILRWDNYSKSLSYEDKNGYSNKNSPLNQYNSNWSEISSKYRESQRWICEQCTVDLTNNKRLLHTHHINSQKNENNHLNLMALCVDCHANQPTHNHMYNNPDTSRSIKEIFELRKKQGIS